jgi:hypothetical protein
MRNTLSLFAEPSLVKEFYLSKSTMNKATTGQYLNRLGIFGVCLDKEYGGLTICGLVNKIKMEWWVSTVFSANKVPTLEDATSQQVQ